MSFKRKRSLDEILELFEELERMSSDLGDAFAELAAQRKADQGLTDCSQKTISPPRLATKVTPPS